MTSERHLADTSIECPSCGVEFFMVGIVPHYDRCGRNKKPAATKRKKLLNGVLLKPVEPGIVPRLNLKPVSPTDIARLAKKKGRKSDPGAMTDMPYENKKCLDDSLYYGNKEYENMMVPPLEDSDDTDSESSSERPDADSLAAPEHQKQSPVSLDLRWMWKYFTIDWYNEGSATCKSCNKEILGPWKQLRLNYMNHLKRYHTSLYDEVITTVMDKEEKYEKAILDKEEKCEKAGSPKETPKSSEPEIAKSGIVSHYDQCRLNKKLVAMKPKAPQPIVSIPKKLTDGLLLKPVKPSIVPGLNLKPVSPTDIARLVQKKGRKSRAMTDIPYENQKCLDDSLLNGNKADENVMVPPLEDYGDTASETSECQKKSPVSSDLGWMGKYFTIEWFNEGSATCKACNEKILGPWRHLRLNYMNHLKRHHTSLYEEVITTVLDKEDKYEEAILDKEGKCEKAGSPEDTPRPSEPEIAKSKRPKTMLTPTKYRKIEVGRQTHLTSIPEERGSIISSSEVPARKKICKTDQQQESKKSCLPRGLPGMDPFYHCTGINLSSKQRAQIEEADEKFGLSLERIESLLAQRSKDIRYLKAKLMDPRFRERKLDALTFQGCPIPYSRCRDCKTVLECRGMYAHSKMCKEGSFTNEGSFAKEGSFTNRKRQHNDITCEGLEELLKNKGDNVWLKKDKVLRLKLGRLGKYLCYVGFGGDLKDNDGRGRRPGTNCIK